MSKENRTVYVMLGLLNHQDLTGYDMKKIIDSSISLFWDVGFGQIYPTLKTLEKDGLVTRRTEQGESGPNRIVYSITEEGRSELRRWLGVPAEKEYVKYEVLLKLFFGSLNTIDDNIRNISEFKARNLINLKTIEGFKGELSSILKDDADHIYYYLVVLFGEHMYRAYTSWADEATKLLESLKKGELL